MVLCSIRLAAVIRAGGKVWPVSEQAMGAGQVSSLELSVRGDEDPSWRLHVGPCSGHKGQCH